MSGHFGLGAVDRRQVQRFRSLDGLGDQVPCRDLSVDCALDEGGRDLQKPGGGLNQPLAFGCAVTLA